ncbi:MAG: UMP kinase [Odoribacteraceae bacterium]|jgi:uridylate kinase|nr:UMP kinase [Odoribacteraceae bacterium]
MIHYQRILLKLSGESLAGKAGRGIDAAVLERYAGEISEISRMGVSVGIVIGGGNIFRGVSGARVGIERVTGDQMGMLATVINGLALCSTLTALGCPCRHMTALRVEPVGEFYAKERAIEYLEAGRVVVFSGGTGNPLFTTDTAGALRAIETRADILLKGTRVDGVYTADPEKDPTAVKFDRVSRDEIYRRDLKVMDLTAATLCQENNMPLVVFNMDVPGNLKRLIEGENVGTIVC